MMMLCAKLKVKKLGGVGTSGGAEAASFPPGGVLMKQDKVLIFEFVIGFDIVFVI